MINFQGILGTVWESLASNVRFFLYLVTSHAVQDLYDEEDEVRKPKKARRKMIRTTSMTRVRAMFLGFSKGQITGNGISYAPNLESSTLENSGPSEEVFGHYS